MVFSAAAPWCQGLLSQAANAAASDRATPQRELNRKTMSESATCRAAARPGFHQPMKASRPCVASVTRAPTGNVTFVGTWPNGRPVRIGVFVAARTAASIDFIP
jgi:hypothetical protein